MLPFVFVDPQTEVPMTVAAANYLRESIMHVPFHQWLRPEVSAVEEDDSGVVIRLPLRPEFRRDPNDPAIHGGIIAALIDIAGHAAIAARTRHGIPTVDIRIDYLRMAAGKEVLAKAKTVKFGRTLGVVDVSVIDDEQRLVATGRCLYLTRAG
jgi:uncharacterized protein (TIGR00369 family)